MNDKGTKPCVPGRKSRGAAVCYDKRPKRIGIMFGGSKDWRRVATRCGRCLKVFLSAVALAEIAMFWL
jgi:hypothetical protein